MRCKGFITTVSTIVLALLAGITLDPPIADAQATCAQEVAGIQAYSKRIDKLIKQRQSQLSKRIFARLTNDARPRPGEWVELEGQAEKTIDGFAESAFAWAIEARQLLPRSLSRVSRGIGFAV